MSSTQAHVGRCPARAGVAGNPSDALGGAAFAVPVQELWAEVELCDAEQLTVVGASSRDGWPSVGSLVEHCRRYGHDGGDRLVSAAIVTLARFCAGRSIEIPDAPFAATWSTNIPRSVGLAGSSAVVVAGLRALSARWGVALDAPLLAALALETESLELGVAAGWMDRATQAHDAPTVVDTRVTASLAGREVPEMTVVRPAEALELVVAWDPAGAAPSGRLHASLHERVVAGDQVVLDAVDQLAAAALSAAEAMRTSDREALAEAVDRTCALRDRLGALDATTARLAGWAHDHGAAATSAGSGGAVLAVPRPGGGESLVAAFEQRGAAALVTRLQSA